MSFCLSGCQGAEADSSDISENGIVFANSFDTGEETSAAESAAPETEEAYMEKCNEFLAEMPPEEILEKKDGAAYPKFEKYTYYSQTAERDTPVNVLLPEGYSEDREYPVLYILHGYYDNQDWMMRDNVHIPEMLTNLIANGEAKEMIVVLPYIYCSKDMPYCTGMDTQNTLNYDNFINDMMTDLMPFIEENFPQRRAGKTPRSPAFRWAAGNRSLSGSHTPKYSDISARSVPLRDSQTDRAIRGSLRNPSLRSRKMRRTSC